MDIVIPYKSEPHQIELRYCLRGIEKYLTGYSDIYLIGDKPNWIQNVIHVPCQDVYGKERSIKNKILKAFETLDRFVFFNDDHFLLKPLDVKDFKYWHSGPIEKILGKARGEYKRVVENTLKAVPGNYYDVHTPIIYEKGEFETTMRLYDWEKREYCIKTIYCKNREGELIGDCKINFNLPKSAIKRRIEGRLFFSTGPHAMLGEMVEVFEELYPKQSKYEKYR